MSIADSTQYNFDVAFLFILYSFVLNVVTFSTVYSTIQDSIIFTDISISQSVAKKLANKINILQVDI